MSTGSNWVVAVGPAGILRSALLTYLRCIPGVEVQAAVACSAEIPPLLRQRQPQSVILDADLTGDFLALIKHLQGLDSQINLIALVNSPQQQAAALAAGATHALLKGFLDERLRQAILLAAPEMSVGAGSPSEKFTTL
jgi:DNA-binding NarL/FixJ family response regulator